MAFIAGKKMNQLQGIAENVVAKDIIKAANSFGMFVGLE
jgi:hypothetical protein